MALFNEAKYEVFKTFPPKITNYNKCFTCYTLLYQQFHLTLNIDDIKYRKYVFVATQFPTFDIICWTFCVLQFIRNVFFIFPYVGQHTINIAQCNLSICILKIRLNYIKFICSTLISLTLMFTLNFTWLYLQTHLEGTAPYAGLLLAPAEKTTDYKNSLTSVLIMFIIFF